MISNSIGKADTKTIPIVTSEKLFLMTGTFPKSTPAPRQRLTYAAAPTRL